MTEMLSRQLVASVYSKPSAAESSSGIRVQTQSSASFNLEDTPDLFVSLAFWACLNPMRFIPGL